MSPHDIDVSHKLKRKGKTFLIVKLISHKIKRNVYKERAKLKNISIASVFPSFRNVAAVGQNRSFINENLTAYRRSLVGKANQMREDGTICSLWTRDGKVFVKT